MLVPSPKFLQKSSTSLVLGERQSDGIGYEGRHLSKVEFTPHGDGGWKMEIEKVRHSKRESNFITVLHFFNRNKKIVNTFSSV